MSERMQQLVGKNIEKVLVDADRQHWIRFVTDGGTFDYHVEGDCCSESWIWAVSGVKAQHWRPSSGEKCQVMSIEEVPLPRFIQEMLAKDGLGRQDEEQFYSFRINCSWGTQMEIEFRNSSNGYYGGDIHLEGAPVDTRWIHVEDDWILGEKPKD